MKTVKFLILLLISISISSCNKNQDEATGIGDAIIISKKIGTNPTTVYGYSLYAYTFSSFQSVKAELVNNIIADQVYTLKSNQGYKTSFYYETAEFTATRPTASTFKFSATFENGATDEFLDEVSDKVLPVPVIEKTEYVTAKNEMNITWAPVSGADSYAINIFDGSKLVYSSPELVNTVKYFPVGFPSGWVSGTTPVDGKEYTVRLLAFLYEPNGNSYNIQAVSLAEKKITWGN